MAIQIRRHPSQLAPDPDMALRLSLEELELGLSHILLATQDENARKRINLLQDGFDALSTCLSNPLLQAKYSAKLGVVGMLVSQVKKVLAEKILTAQDAIVIETLCKAANP